MDIDVKVFHGINENLIELLCELEAKIFPNPYTIEKVKRSCEGKYKLLTLIAFAGDEAVGYKVGYELQPHTFYSWMGGVVAEYRGGGIASRLMTQQHALVAGMGYATIRTHTENQYRAMLLLNIRTGFDVVGVINDSSKQKSIIVLDKQLIQ